jgi:dTDP-4-amino-4,6-dideoxygalactose transaminase
LLPAYGCPDLVAAAVHAGTEPRLVDTGGQDPSFDTNAVARAWDAEVVAVVAVNFLGVRERIGFLRELARSRGGIVVEDHAQAYPEQALDADAVVLSFGRGKPVNLLGGGAFLLRAPDQSGRRLRQRRGSTAVFWARAAAFNLATRRSVYGWLSRLPGLHVGETRYRQLRCVKAIDSARLRRLAANADAWLARSRWREEWLSRKFSGMPGVIALPVELAGRAGRLLRYPVLMRDRETRDRALAALLREGLGASNLYAVPIPDIPGVPEEVRVQRAIPGAQAFAERLITLPLHDGVNEDDLSRIVATLGSSVASARSSDDLKKKLRQ